MVKQVSYVRFLSAVIALPILVNSAIWGFFTVPQRAHLKKLRNVQTMTETRPQLELLIQQGDGILASWKGSAFSRDDVASVSPALQRSSEKHRVLIKQIREGKTPGAVSGPNTRHLEIEAAGRFNKLARWLSDLEGHAGFVVDSWTIASDGGAGGSCKLTMNITAILGDS